MVGVANLEVNTLALVRDNEEWVHWALGPPGLLCGTLAWHGVALQPGPDWDVGEEGSAAAALDGDLGGLGPHT